MANTSLIENPFDIVALDIGSSKVKAMTRTYKTAIVSQSARNAGHVSRADNGVKAATRPMLITQRDGSEYYVGNNAHAWGARRERHDMLDTNRLPQGGSKILSLVYATLTDIIETQGEFKRPLMVCVGTPIGVDRAGRTAVEKWLKGAHTWRADGYEYAIEIEHAYTIPQTTAAIFDYSMKLDGTKDKRLEPKLGERVLAISGGMFDLQAEGRRWMGAWEELVNATANWPYGTSQLYEKLKHGGESIGAIDQDYFAGVWNATPEARAKAQSMREAWANEVFSLLDGLIGDWSEFQTVIPYGGIMEMQEIKDRFAARLTSSNYIELPDPVFAQARGMLKWLVAKSQQVARTQQVK